MEDTSAVPYRQPKPPMIEDSPTMDSVSSQPRAWSEGTEGCGTLDWGEAGQGPLCDKPGGMFVTDLDMNAALAAERKAGDGVYPCATCCARYRGNQRHPHAR